MAENPLNIALVSPSSTFEAAQLEEALLGAASRGFTIKYASAVRPATPLFLNGSKEQRLKELADAEALDVDALWCTRGGCGAIELWQDYSPEFYEHKKAVLIGYSDISLLHLLRFKRAGRIGIHGPCFFDLADERRANVPSIRLLIEKKAERLSYPPLRRVNHFISPFLEGELIVMNLMLLQCAIGTLDTSFFRGAILAIEDINEAHYRVFRTLHHLKNAGVLAGLRALIIGQFNVDRQQIITETLKPLADELGIPLFDWPIFGHEKPNWPLLFGAKACINLVDHDLFTLKYLQQHDQSIITPGL